MSWDGSTCWPGFWLVVYSCVANQEPACLLTISWQWLQLINFHPWPARWAGNLAWDSGYVSVVSSSLESLGLIPLLPEAKTLELDLRPVRGYFFQFKTRVYRLIAIQSFPLPAKCPTSCWLICRVWRSSLKGKGEDCSGPYKGEFNRGE